MAENCEQLASRAEIRAGEMTARSCPAKGGSGDPSRSGSAAREGLVKDDGPGDSCFIVRDGVKRVGG